MAERRRGEDQGAGDGEVGDATGDRHPLGRRGKAHPVQHPVRLGEQVEPPEGGAPAGDLGDDCVRRIGEDLVGEVGGAKEREVVAPGERGRPFSLLSCRHELRGALTPALRQLREAVMGLRRARGDRRPASEAL